MTLYLKYRSQTLAELDIFLVREMLTKLLASGNLPHALLFCGSRGTGKTSSARILAKAINCLDKQGIEPCNKCQMCLDITSGRAADVIEIDAASNRGIDEIRDLREKVRLAPISAQKKVYIIDEVHMLTLEAANALLKTLEEPPDNTVFILCTTDPQKLPETVVSRCMVLRIPKPSLEEIKAKLQKISIAEGFKVSDDDLGLIAKGARGSFRDGIKLLEQVVSSGMNASQVLGMSLTITPEEFLSLVGQGETKRAIEIISRLVEQGVEMKSFIEKCVEYLRDAMIAKNAKGLDAKSEIQMISELFLVYEQTKNAVVSQLPLEVWVVGKNISSSSEVFEKVSEKKISINAKSNQDVKAEIPVYAIGVKDQEKKDDEKKVEEITPKNEPVVVKSDVVSEIVVGTSELGDVVEKWNEVLKAVRPVNHSIEALLKSTRPIGFDGKRVQLEVFYKFHKDKLETDKCRVVVEEALSKVMGVFGVKLMLKLTEKKQTQSSDNIVGNVEEDIVSAAAEIFRAEVI